jgi:transposase
VFEILHRVVGGLDVHKKIILACRRRILESGEIEKEVGRFGTYKVEIERMRSWLLEWRIEVVAMESTGVYWKPIWNGLEKDFKLILVNAQYIKKMPGRKTDVKDCEWIAQLLQVGMLKASFVPPKRIRQLRNLTRLRFQMIRHKASDINRIHKVLEDGSIKLGSAISDVMGVSGRKILKAIADGEDRPEILMTHAVSRIRKEKFSELCQALDGYVDDHHRFQLKILFEQIEFLEKQIAELDGCIAEMVKPYEAEIEILKSHPAIAQRSSENVIAEVGVDMNQFPDDSHLASWGGVCPGNNESAGKHKTGKTTKGDRWLKAVLTEVSWASTRTKDSSLSSRYRRIARRRGKKRAIVALNHANLRIIYHMLKNHKNYQELGSNYFAHYNAQRSKRYFVHRLKELGFEVELKLIQETA